MSLRYVSRERRIVHLALREQTDLRTQSEARDLRRYVVVYPQNYKLSPANPHEEVSLSFGPV